jgi:hypothetical protein
VVGGARFLSNARTSGQRPPLADYQERVRAFVREEAGFAQVVTINRHGFPVGRTMVAPLEDDWSVLLVQRRVHHRIGQWRRIPSTEIIWVGSPHRDNRNLAPHVYDWCVQVPRVVFLRGVARFLDDEALVAAYERQSRRNREAGRQLAPERDADEVVRELVGVRVEPVQVRAEGFGPGPESVTWQVEAA